MTLSSRMAHRGYFHLALFLPETLPIGA
jgi:hypothetical protein